MRSNGVGSPVEYPSITIGSEVLTVKLGLRAELILSQAGLSFSNAVKSLVPIDPKKMDQVDPRRLAYAFQLLAACVAHNYPDGQAPKPEQWADKIDSVTGGDIEANRPIIIAIYDALTKAVVKRLPSPKVQDTAASTEAPATN